MLSDMLKHVEIYNELIKSQGYCMETPPTIMQDNQSTISLVTKRGGAMRNKHLRVRQNLVKEAVDNLRIKIEFVPTREMLADGQTKPIQGAWREALTRQLMGLTSNKVGCDGQQGCVEQNTKSDGKRQGNDGRRTVVSSAPANLEKNSGPTERNSGPTYATTRSQTHAKKGDVGAMKDPDCVRRSVG